MLCDACYILLPQRASVQQVWNQITLVHAFGANHSTLHVNAQDQKMPTFRHCYPVKRKSNQTSKASQSIPSRRDAQHRGSSSCQERSSACVTGEGWLGSARSIGQTGVVCQSKGRVHSYVGFWPRTVMTGCEASSGSWPETARPDAEIFDVFVGGLTPRHHRFIASVSSRWPGG